MPVKAISVFTIALTVLVSFASITGLQSPAFYHAESFNWQLQARGQDMIDLYLVVPVLLLSAFAASRGNKPAGLIWCGTLLYLVYTFIIYSFSIHFNRLFLVYCTTLGLSFYGALWYLHGTLQSHVESRAGMAPPNRSTGIYFVAVAVIFYLLWLSEILPAIWKDAAPLQLREIGLIVNPVHVLDLSVVLPGIFITGLLVLRRKTLSLVMAPVVLVFFILMDITIAWLMLLMKRNGLPANNGVAIAMFVAAILSAGLLLWNFRIMQPPSKRYLQGFF